MKIFSRWYWRVYCPCGYKSRWTRKEWLTHLTAISHGLSSGHKIGKMTIAACDVGKIERQVYGMQRWREK